MRRICRREPSTTSAGAPTCSMARPRAFSGLRSECARPRATSPSSGSCSAAASRRFSRSSSARRADMRLKAVIARPTSSARAAGPTSTAAPSSPLPRRSAAAVRLVSGRVRRCARTAAPIRPAASRARLPSSSREPKRSSVVAIAALGIGIRRCIAGPRTKRTSRAASVSSTILRRCGPAGSLSLVAAPATTAAPASGVGPGLLKWSSRRSRTCGDASPPDGVGSAASVSVVTTTTWVSVPPAAPPSRASAPTCASASGCGLPPSCRLSVR